MTFSFLVFHTVQSNRLQSRSSWMVFIFSRVSNIIHPFY